MNTPKIALTGRMRSGKNTVADYLAEHYGYTQFAFADGIKELCRELFPDYFEGDSKPRALFQGVGQDMRKYDEDVWVRKCFRDINQREYDCIEYEEDPEYFRPVITDLRQPNEFVECKRQGFTIIRVNCDDKVRLERMKASGDAFNPADLTHETESHVDGFNVDFDVFNSGGFVHTFEQIDVIMTELGVVRT